MKKKEVIGFQLFLLYNFNSFTIVFKMTLEGQAVGECFYYYFRDNVAFKIDLKTAQQISLVKKSSCKVFLYISVFELLLEIHFAINILSVVRLLPCHRQKCFLKMFKNCKAFFAFCGVILGTNNICFDNSMQWMNEIRI